MRYPYRALVAALLALAGGAVAQQSAPAAAVAGDHRTAATTALPDVIAVQAPSLFPEAVDFDPRRRQFVVGSTSGTVSTVDLDGTLHTLVEGGDLPFATGIRVDAVRDRVLVTNLSLDNRVAGLASYALGTGRRQWHVDLAAVAADGGPHFTNDVAVGPDGTAYVVDGVSPTVFRVDARGHGSVLLRDDRLRPTGSLPGFQAVFGVNTVAWIGDGNLLLSAVDGTLWRLPVHRPGGLARITVTGTVNVFVDGARVLRNGDVAVITNGWFGAQPSVQRLSLSRGARAAHVRSTVGLLDPLPTGITPGPGGSTYAMTGRLDLAFQGLPSEGFTLRRVRP